MDFQIGPGERHDATALTAILFTLLPFRMPFLRQTFVVEAASLQHLAKRSLALSILTTVARSIMNQTNLMPIVGGKMLCMGFSHSKTRDRTAAFIILKEWIGETVFDFIKAHFEYHLRQERRFCDFPSAATTTMAKIDDPVVNPFCD